MAVSLRLAAVPLSSWPRSVPSAATRLVPKGTVLKVLSSDRLPGSTCAELAVGLNPSPDLLTTVLTLYLGESSDLMSQLAKAAKAGDTEAMSRTAHSLKSASGNVGAKKLAALCREVEKFDPAQATHGAVNIVSAVQMEHEAVCAILSEEVTGTLGSAIVAFREAVARPARHTRDWSGRSAASAADDVAPRSHARLCRGDATP